MKFYLAVFALLVNPGSVQGEPNSAFENAIGNRYACADTLPASLPERRNGFSYIVMARLCLDKRFSQTQSDLLIRAFNEMQARLVKPSVYSCYRAATSLLATVATTKESFAEFLDHFVIRIIGGSVQGLSFEPAYFFLSSEKNAEAPWGQFVGRADLFEDSAFSSYQSSLKRFSAFRLNDTVVGAKNLPFGNEVAYWAAALGMAMLSEAGVNSDSQSPARSPLYEIGKCLLWDGKVPREFRSAEVWK